MAAPRFRHLTETGMMEWRLALPADYRAQDVLSFHSRDTQGVAEQVSGTRLRKAIMLDGVAIELDIMIAQLEALCSVHADGPCPPALAQKIGTAVRNVLGLRIDPQPFIDFTRDDSLMGPLARRRPGLRIVQSASVFEALTWAIIGQQINLAFAIALRRSFILMAGHQHPSGLWCYPEAADLARFEANDLTTRKFSRAKAETLLRMARMVADGALSLDLLPDTDIQAAMQNLIAVKGIGPWTVNYTLLRGYGYADCSLHGDVAIRSALQRLNGLDAKPDISTTEQFLAAYRPHRTMAAAHLWASISE